MPVLCRSISCFMDLGLRRHSARHGRRCRCPNAARRLLLIAFVTILSNLAKLRTSRHRIRNGQQEGPCPNYSNLLNTQEDPKAKETIKMTSIHPTYLQRAVPLPSIVYIVSYTLQPEIGFSCPNCPANPCLDFNTLLLLLRGSQIKKKNSK